MLINILLLTAGLLLLIKGADWLVNGASSLAKRYHVSDLAIGLTIVAFGTSAPELVVNVMGSVEGHHDIVFANVIGSNNFNLFVILGIAGIITPLAVQSSTVWKEIPFSFFAIVLLFILANDIFLTEFSVLSRVDGVLLLLFFSGFLIYVYRQLSSDIPVPGIQNEKQSPLKITLLIVAGLTSLVLGGRFVVNNAIEIATIMGVSEKIIGLTIVAAGTSLPELATSVMAAIRKNIDLAVGNIVGSNIFNFGLILGISALVNPVEYKSGFNTELYLLSIGTIILFIGMFTGNKKKLDRWEAILLLLLFIAYTFFFVLPQIA